MERDEQANASPPPHARLSNLGRWAAWLAAPVDGASVALFRIAFGLVMVWEVGRFFSYDWIAEDYIEPEFYFEFVAFASPWPGDGMYVHFFAMGVLAVLVALGLFYRIAAALFFLAFTYVFLLDKTQYQNHFYLVSLVSFLMAIVPAHHTWSLDRALGRTTGDETVPRWALDALRLQIVIVYFFGGVAKLDGDWLRGDPLSTWLLDSVDLPIVGPLFTLPWTGVLMAWSGMLLDLSVGFLLMGRRTFWTGVAAAGAFHLLNSQMFVIGIFPAFMLATLALFPRPDWPRLLLARLAGHNVGRERDAAAKTVEASARGSRPGRYEGAAILALLHVYFLAQLTLPLRHWLYPGEVNWTEEGHRFSWRMKLRDKEAVEFRMTVVDPRTGERYDIEPLDWLTERQCDKMTVRPDMIYQFARHVADEYERDNGVRPVVKVTALVSLNGKPARDLIDPEADLAAHSPSLGPAAWIMPFGGE